MLFIYDCLASEYECAQYVLLLPNVYHHKPSASFFFLLLMHKWWWEEIIQPPLPPTLLPSLLLIPSHNFPKVKLKVKLALSGTEEDIAYPFWVCLCIIASQLIPA